MDILYFATPVELRRWFEENHMQVRELHLGYYKKGSGKPSVTWPQSVEQALCFGWIDGVRHTINAESYTIRFTPRRVGSAWSALNIKVAQGLIEQGLMTPAGLKAFETHHQNPDSGYSVESRPQELPPAEDAELQANPAAWEYWQQQTASYRRAAVWWVTSAKQDATRRKRLATLIEDCAAQRAIKAMARQQTAKSRTKGTL
jgi:uncharacterized protein YdeI (YjbR/CyaY-like superfamily)